MYSVIETKVLLLFSNLRLDSSGSGVLATVSECVLDTSHRGRMDVQYQEV